MLVFDETYYVNAARVIAGISPPLGQPYHRAPHGDDPNSEHPQLAKVVMAGAIDLFGDGPLAWRLGSELAGTLAILGMFALARGAGGDAWLGVLAAALMAADNLMLVHGRIGTLDIYVLAAMVWSVALYLRGRRLAAGVVLGIGACFKLVAPYSLLVLVVFELLARGRRARGSPRPAWVGAGGRIAVVAGVAAVTGFALLSALDWLVPPYDPGTHRVVGGGALGHLGHMLSYAAHQVSPHGPAGIASYPWMWLVDLRPIVYLNVNPSQPAPGLAGIEPPVHFLGMISPPLLILGLPALAVMAWRLLRDPATGQVPAVALAWLAGTFVPFLAFSLVWQRTSYLYYMVVVMPAIYLGCAWAAARLADRLPRVVMAWGATVLLAAVAMYPFTPVP